MAIFFSMSPRDKIILLWWGGGNFFFHLKFVTTRLNNFLVVGWSQFFFIWNLSRRDKIIFLLGVEPTESSLFNYI